MSGARLISFFHLRLCIRKTSFHIVYDAEGMRIEKGIGEQALLELRRQGRLLRIKDIELDVYRSNQPMRHFLDHLIKTHRLPLVKHEMTYGRPFDATYLIPC